MKNRSDTIMVSQNLWGRTPRIAGARAVTVWPLPPNFVRLFRWFNDTGVDRREAFLDTVPGVMFEHE